MHVAAIYPAHTARAVDTRFGKCPMKTIPSMIDGSEDRQEAVQRDNSDGSVSKKSSILDMSNLLDSVLIDLALVSAAQNQVQ